MTAPWIILDVSYLSHRAYHAFKWMRSGSTLTGCLYGVLRDVVSIADRFQSSKFAFCFDGGRNLRKGMCSTYKSKATNNDRMAVIRDDKKNIKEQIKTMREEQLPEFGFANILVQEGYEADDIIASICKEKKHQTDGGIIIVSADEDLYQLLTADVAIWNPRKKELYTNVDLHQEWKILPEEWVEVKALAGCSSDSIPGVPRVGNKVAAQYVTGHLPSHTLAWKSITNPMYQELISRNRKLVKLPLEGCNSFELTDIHCITQKRWIKYCRKYEMDTLERSVPFDI